MGEFVIRPAEEGDLGALDMALSALSQEIGDTHRAGVPELRRALFGTPPSASALVAETHERIAGAVLLSPIFSTVRGGAGVFVSDVWVDGAVRGNGLGRRLLNRAAQVGAEFWDARFMRLAVHDDNARACAFYGRLGFSPVVGETVLVLDGESFERLRSRT